MPVACRRFLLVPLLLLAACGLLEEGDPGPMLGDLTGSWRDSHGDLIEITQHGTEVQVTAISEPLRAWWTEASGKRTGGRIRVTHRLDERVTTVESGRVPTVDLIEWKNGTSWKRLSESAHDEGAAQPTQGAGGAELPSWPPLLGGSNSNPADTTTPVEPGTRFDLPANSTPTGVLRRLVNTENRTLSAGVHYHKFENGQWVEVTDDDELKDLLNAPVVPEESPSGDAEDWYRLDMDQTQPYEFAVAELDFEPKIGYAYTIPNTLGFNWDWEARPDGKVLLGGTTQFRPGFTGPQWVVISTRRADRSAEDRGDYAFTFTRFEGAATVGGYGEASEVARLRVPQLNQLESDGSPTKIHLNFEGGQYTYFDQNGKLVVHYDLAAFDAEPYLASELRAAKDRDGVIQHILFKSAELYTPFGVNLVREHTSGVVDQTAVDTTVFIGDDTLNEGNFGAHPSTFRNFDFGNRRPNQSYVDPFGTNGKLKSSQWIAQAIAHEAGHSFGLSHVRTRGRDWAEGTEFRDWAQAKFLPRYGPEWTNAGEMMSYDSTNSVFRFRNFNVTGWNQAADGLEMAPRLYAVVDGSVILEQNSYSYLMAVLGARSRHGDRIANVADRDTILQDADRATLYLNALSPSRDGGTARNEEEREEVANAFAAGLLEPDSLVKFDLDKINALPLLTDELYATVPSRGEIEAIADYDVFLIGKPPSSLTVSIQCTPSEGSELDPILLVYDKSGRLLLGYDNDSGEGKASSVSVSFLLTDAIKIVVGAKDNASVGEYELRLQ